MDLCPALQSWWEPCRCRLWTAEWRPRACLAWCRGPLSCRSLWSCECILGACWWPPSETWIERRPRHSCPWSISLDTRPSCACRRRPPWCVCADTSLPGGRTSDCSQNVRPSHPNAYWWCKYNRQNILINLFSKMLIKYCICKLSNRKSSNYYSCYFGAFGWFLQRIASSNLLLN